MVTVGLGRSLGLGRVTVGLGRVTIGLGWCLGRVIVHVGLGRGVNCRTGEGNCRTGVVFRTG